MISEGVKAIYCEKPLATTVEDTDRMLQACADNDVTLSVDHTRRFTRNNLPHLVVTRVATQRFCAACDAALWRYAKEQLLDKGEIGEVQWVFARLQGNRAMMFRWAPPPRHPSTRPRFHNRRGSGCGGCRNGTHVIDAMLWFTGTSGNEPQPDWVLADFECAPAPLYPGPLCGMSAAACG